MLQIRNVSRVAASCAVAALCVGLTGCSGAYRTDVDGAFSSAALTAMPGGIPFQVDGKVGEIQGAPLAASVAAAMPAAIDGKPVQYAACAPFTECPGDHLVWTFGPPAARPRTVHPPALATNINWIGIYRPAANNIGIKLALFQGGDVVMSTSGQIDADNPSDPAFQAMIADMSHAVLSGPDRIGWP